MMPGGMPIDHGRLLGAWGDEVELLLEGSRSAPHELPVRTCPGWTVGEVVRHVGSIYRSVLAWLSERARPRDWQRDPAPVQPVESYLREAFVDLRQALSYHEPGVWAAGWWPADETYGFWLRRMTHETTVHRIDVEDAADLPAHPVDDDIAADGIDEVLSLWFGHRLPLLGLSGTRPGAVAVRAGRHAWFARAGPDDTTAWWCPDGEAAEALERADAAVSGSPEVVYRWLWGRSRLGTVDVGGDDDAAGQLWALLRLATK